MSEEYDKTIKAIAWDCILKAAQDNGDMTIIHIGEDTHGHPLYTITTEGAEGVSLQGTEEQLQDWLISTGG